MTKTKLISLSVADRKLGDEWAGWDGHLCDSDISVKAGKRLFIGFSLLGVVLISVGAFFTWYMISPRLYGLSAQFAASMKLTIEAFVLLLFIWLFLNVLSILTDKNLLLHFYGSDLSVTFLGPLVMRLSRRFGVNKDRMGHSFVKVSNSIIHASKKNLEHVKLLILLPHCLKRSILDAIKELANKYQVPTYVASGGSIARKIILEQHPTAVIGIACERDLVAGIQDIMTKIPVIGIPNQRPEGPCKNTTVNFEEVENAIRFFLRRQSAESAAH